MYPVDAQKKRKTMGNPIQIVFFAHRQMSTVKMSLMYHVEHVQREAKPYKLGTKCVFCASPNGYSNVYCIPVDDAQNMAYLCKTNGD